MLFKFPDLEVVPTEITRAFELAMERMAFVFEGKGDPDRPIEMLEGAFVPLIQVLESSKHKKQLEGVAVILARFLKFLAERPTLRRLIVKKALRGWRAVVDDALEPGHRLAAYANPINAEWAGASLLAFSCLPGLAADGQSRIIQANTFLAEASGRTGESRFNSTKKLARVVLDELYPHYLEALCVLESLRLGDSVIPGRKQSPSFGSMVRGLKASLPANAQALIDPDANKIRNAFAHCRVRWVRETDVIELRDETWSMELPTTELLARLESMHSAYLECLVFLLVHGCDFGVRVAEQHLTWEVITKKLPDFEDAFGAAIKPAVERLKPWFQNVAASQQEKSRALASTAGTVRDEGRDQERARAPSA